MTVETTGLTEAILRLKSLPDVVRARLTGQITAEAIRLQGIIKDDKLSGGVLKNRTGRLRASINYRVASSAQSVTGIVGADMNKAGYAAFHEYGFTGTEQVREHLRTMSVCFGKMVTPREVLVRAHQRRVDYPGRSFLRSTLSEEAEGIKSRLAAAVAEAATTEVSS